jgi:prepilin-type N-terminal cleavage/methylation domain-containing protein
MRSKSFTLIELLIVVAIIAILAAIAVPNFLEAQVRAKVSRAKSDMRSVRVGLEAYAVDSNHYPDPATTIWHPTLQDIPMLTTPMAYLSSFPSDPFPLKEPGKYYTPELLDHGKNYRYYNTQRWEETFPQLNQKGLKWYMMSNGPDLDNDVNDETGVVADDELNGKNYMYYDSTNGTTSRGDIIVNNVKSAQ